MYSPAIFISSSCQAGDSLFEAIDLLVDHDIRHVELSGGKDFIPNIDNELLHYKKAYGLSFLLHNYFPPPKEHFVLNIAATDERLRIKSVEFAKKSILLAAKLGISLYTIHAGYMTDLMPDKTGEHFISTTKKMSDKKDSLKSFVRSVDDLSTFAARHNIKIGVENLFPDASNRNYSLMCTEKEIDWFMDRFPMHKNLGLLFDLGHAKISAQLLRFDLVEFSKRIVTKYRQRIFALHLSDNDGHKDLHILPPKDSWTLPFIKAENLTDIPISIEARNSKITEIIDFYYHSKYMLKVR